MQVHDTNLWSVFIFNFMNFIVYNRPSAGKNKNKEHIYEENVISNINDF